MISYNPKITHPWWAGGAVEVVNRFLQEEMQGAARVFEYGAGMSSKWLADRCAFYRGVEHSKMWYVRVSNLLKGKDHAKVIATDGKGYSERIKNWETFNLVVIDGFNRNYCAQVARDYVKPGGMILLDDSDASVYASARSFLDPWPFTDHPAVKGDGQRKDKLTTIYRRPE